MPRLWFLGLLIAIVVGGWYFLTHFEIEGVESLSVAPRVGQENEVSQPVAEEEEQLPVREGVKTIRIATVNLGPFDQQKMNKQYVVDRLVEVVRQLDVVAVQDVRARDQGILLEFVEQINAGGQHYDFAAPPNVGRDPVEQYSAFLFDRATLQIDRGTVSPVKDPADRFRREPLVASFQTRGPSAAEAFTFTLINVHIDPSRADELDLLDDVFRAVRDDGRGEDDILLLGDLGTDDRRLGPLREVPNITWAISGVPSTTRGTRLVDNVLFDRRATAEFTGRSGVVDLIRQFDLSMRQAVEISDHLPVWVECSVYEGGQAGHVASEQPVSTQ